MPGPLLHAGATVLCAHTGQAQPTAPNPRVLLSGQPVVTVATPYVVAGCQLPSMTSGAPPCVSAQWIVGATRVFAAGAPVLLMDSQALCVPTGGPLLPIAAQPRVVGM